ncbi:MAG: nuclear transport factor 2 family protein [Longimicrobiales bacterium]
MKKSTVVIASALFLTATVPHPTAAQTAEDEVLAVVSGLFEGMRAKDAETLKSLFHPDALMTGTGMRDGSYQVTMNPPDGWISSISSFTGGEIDERFYDPKVEISGPLASVWTEYDLYVGGEFRHCGVDAFHLALTDDGWKIVHVADTRVQEGCPAR